MNFSRLFLLLFIVPGMLYAQNWSTLGGNGMRNGSSPMTGPATAQLRWVKSNYPQATWGGVTYTEGNRFVTNRIQVGQYSDLVAGDLLSGELLWTFRPHPNSVMLPLGISKNTLYAVDFVTQTGDTLYAIDLTTFEVLWKTPPICWNGFTSSIVFACNGDPIINGVIPAQAVVRLDRRTGEVVWVNAHFTTINGLNGTCQLGDRLYTWEGSLATPKRVRVLDAETGATLFASAPLPGDGDQEIRLVAGPDSTVYACRDGGLLYALHDTGNSFETRWTYSFTEAQPGVYSNFALGPDGSVYVPEGASLRRLDGATGQVLNTSAAFIPGFSTLMAAGADGTVYVGTCGFGSDGKYLAFSADLQTVQWQVSIPNNYYSGPLLGREGILLVSGSGGSLRAYHTPGQTRAPVADFSADKVVVQQGGTVQFSEQCSYAPTAYAWSFPGGMPSAATGPAPPPVQYNTPGVYAVCLIAANEYGADTLEQYCYIEVTPASSVSQAIGAASLFVSPNPAGAWCRIDLPEAGGVLQVFDTAGRLVLQQDEAPEGAFLLDVGAWPRGSYFLRYHTGRQICTARLAVH